MARVFSWGRAGPLFLTEREEGIGYSPALVTGRKERMLRKDATGYRGKKLPLLKKDHSNMHTKDTGPGVTRTR